MVRSSTDTALPGPKRKVDLVMVLGVVPPTSRLHPARWLTRHFRAALGPFPGGWA
jgi:hypothetical protein